MADIITLDELHTGDRFRPVGTRHGLPYPVWQVIRFAGESKLYARLDVADDDTYGSSLSVGEGYGGQRVELIERARRVRYTADDGEVVEGAFLGVNRAQQVGVRKDDGYAEWLATTFLNGDDCNFTLEVVA